MSERAKKVARRRKAARRSAFKEMDRHSIPRLKAACKDKIAQSFEYFIYINVIQSIQSNIDTFTFYMRDYSNRLNNLNLTTDINCY